MTLRTRDAHGNDLHSNQVKTGADGTFALTLPDAPSVALITKLPGFVAEVTDVAPAVRGQQQLVQLDRAAEIRGAVQRDGDPCRAAVGLLRLADQQVVATTETTVAGDFELHSVPAGDYELLVDPVAGARRRQRVSARTDRPLVLEVDVQAGATCAGRVLGDIALPAEVVLRQQDGFARRGLVRADGTFVVEGLSAGEWSALAYSKQRTWAAKAARMLLARRPWRADLAVSEAAVQSAQRVPLDVAAPSRRLGTLRAQLPPTDAGATFSLEPLDEAGRGVPPGLLRGAVDSNGALRMDAVLPGAWRLLLQRAAGPHTAKVQVTAGATCWLEPATLQPRHR